MKIPCPVFVVHVSPVSRDVHVNAAKRHVLPYASLVYFGYPVFEL